MQDRQNDLNFRIAEESDFPAILDLFRRNDFGPQGLDWLKWKYLKSPDGPARLYIAVLPDGTVVGIIVHLPRRVTGARTGPLLIFQNVDMLVDERMRGKRVYSRLGKLVRRERDYLMYGFPNEFSEWTITDKVDTVLSMEIWKFPVSLGRAIAGRPYGFLRPLVDMLSRLYAFLRLGRPPKHLRMRPMERFDRDFELDSTSFHGVRSADYLNWRFVDNPASGWSVFGFFVGEECIGYCVYAKGSGVARIFDFVADRDQRKCLRLLVDHCFDLGISHLDFEGVGLELRKYGFLRRRSDAKLTLTDTWGDLKIPRGTWLFTLSVRVQSTTSTPAPRASPLR